MTWSCGGCRRSCCSRCGGEHRFAKVGKLRVVHCRFRPFNFLWRLLSSSHFSLLGWRGWWSAWGTAGSSHHRSRCFPKVQRSTSTDVITSTFFTRHNVAFGTVIAVDRVSQSGFFCPIWFHLFTPVVGVVTTVTTVTARTKRGPRFHGFRTHATAATDRRSCFTIQRTPLESFFLCLIILPQWPSAETQRRCGSQRSFCAVLRTADTTHDKPTVLQPLTTVLHPVQERELDHFVH